MSTKYRVHRFDLKMKTDLTILPSYSRYERKMIYSQAKFPYCRRGNRSETEMSCPKSKCRANVVHTTWSFWAGFL